MPKPMIESVRWINRIRDIVKFNEVEIINGLNISNLKSISKINNKIKDWNEKVLNNNGNKKLKTTKLSEVYGL